MRVKGKTKGSKTTDPGLRKQRQIRHNLEQPIEESPETLERAVRRDRPSEKKSRDKESRFSRQD